MWRPLFVIMLAFSLIDGFISNWQTGNPLALLYKDFFLIFVFIFFLGNENFRKIIQEMGRYLGGFVFVFALVFIFIAIIQIFNPYAPGLELGILGFKLYFLYWFAVPMAYAYVSTVERAIYLLKVIVVCSIFVNLFALYQFMYGPDWIISRFGPGFLYAFREAALDEAIGAGGVKSFFRVIGTFASTGQYSNFLQANVMFCFPLIFTAKSRNEKMIWYAAQLLNFVGLLAAGSRGSILFTMGEIALFCFFARGRRSVTGMIAVAAICFTIGLVFMGGGVRARFGTIGQVSMVQERTVGSTSTIFSSYLEKFPLGKGIGFASTAARYLNPLNKTTQQNWVENYPTKLQVEVGIPGVIVFFLFLGTLLKRWLLDWIPRLTPETWDIALPLSAYGIFYTSFLSLFGILETTPGALFICVVAGIVIRLVELSGTDENVRSPYPSWDT